MYKPKWLIKFSQTLNSAFGGKKVVEIETHKPRPEPAILPIPQIRCIAKQILGDLDVNNPKRLKAKYTDFGKSYYGYVVLNKIKNYTLIIKKSGWQSDWTVFLKGVSSFDFNHDEKEAIYQAVEALDNLSAKEQEDKRKAKDNLKLKKIFPECFEITKPSGVNHARLE